MLLTGRAAGVLTFATLLISLSSVAKIKQVDAVPGEFIIRLKPHVAISNKAHLTQQLGAFVKATLPGQNIIVVKRPSFETKASAINALAANQLVELVEPNFIYKINRTPDDPMLGQL